MPTTHQGHGYIAFPTRRRTSAETGTSASTQHDSGEHHTATPNEDSSAGDPTSAAAPAPASAHVPEEESGGGATPPPVSSEPSTVLLLQLPVTSLHRKALKEKITELYVVTTNKTKTELRSQVDAGELLQLNLELQVDELSSLKYMMS